MATQEAFAQEARRPQIHRRLVRRGRTRGRRFPARERWRRPPRVAGGAYCPRDLTHAEKEEQCVSVQEHVWGTDGLAKLEAIKAKVDPQGLFQCQKCVGFKGPVRDQ